MPPKQSDLKGGNEADYKGFTENEDPLFTQAQQE